MAKATTAAQLEATAAAGATNLAEDDAYVGIQDPAVNRGTGPNGIEAPTKAEKSVVLKAVVAPEVTSVNPPAYSADELSHRFTGIPPTGYTQPIFPHPQV